MSVALLGTIVGTVAAILIAIAMRPKPGTREHKLINRPDTMCYPIEQLPGLSRLAADGSFAVRTFRQSGNPQQADRFFESGPAALAAAMGTFRRSKIDYVVIMDNHASELSFRRPVH